MKIFKGVKYTIKKGLNGAHILFIPSLGISEPVDETFKEKDILEVI